MTVVANSAVVIILDYANFAKGFRVAVAIYTPLALSRVDGRIFAVGALCWERGVRGFIPANCRKIVLALTANITIIIVLGNTIYTKWFGGGGLCFFKYISEWHKKWG